MKKNLLAIALCSVIAVPMSTWAAQTTVKPSVEYALEAYQLEPYRTDLLISAANAQIYNKNVDKAIELFQQALSVAPDDVDLHTYLAVWQKFKGNEQAYQQHVTALNTLNPGRAADLQRLLSTVDRILQTPLKEKATRPLGSDRIERGISANRIIEENYATSTVDNALFSAYALARHGVKHATIISSASHVRRGQTLFEIATWQTGPRNITFDTVAYPEGIYRDALRTFGMWSYRSSPLEFR